MGAAATGGRLIEALVDFTKYPALAHDDVTCVGVESVPGPKWVGVWEGLRNHVLGPRP